MWQLRLEARRSYYYTADTTNAYEPWTTAAQVEATVLKAEERVTKLGHQLDTGADAAMRMAVQWGVLGC